ncbi:MAG: ferric reductase-like transmembrane domain-containing protein, partial [Spirochaetes bacterium]|nr:ferric reductase-like transmembrane domain-containing protein [Spirochaetota bacterium]
MKKIFWVIFVLVLAVPIYFWSQNFSIGLPFAFLAYSFSQILALIGFILLFWQIVLTSRLKWIDRLFGLDKITAIHRISGMITYVIILLHPLSFYTFEIIQTGVIGLSLLKLVGTFAFILISIAVITVLLYKIVQFSFETWRKLHVVNYIAFFLVFYHSINLGSNVTSYVFLRWLWYIFYGLVILIILSKIAKYQKIKNNPYTITQINKLNSDVVEIKFTGKSLNLISGQFIFINFGNYWKYWEYHPFTISAATENEMTITVKAVGDFTKSINEAMVQKKVFIDGPYGKFCLPKAIKNKVVF